MCFFLLSRKLQIRSKYWHNEISRIIDFFAANFKSHLEQTGREGIFRSINPATSLPAPFMDMFNCVRKIHLCASTFQLDNHFFCDRRHFIFLLITISTWLLDFVNVNSLLPLVGISNIAANRHWQCLTLKAVSTFDSMQCFPYHPLKSVKQLTCHEFIFFYFFYFTSLRIWMTTKARLQIEITDVDLNDLL